MCRLNQSIILQMDRTAILGDTIDYVKELTERIKTLEEEIGATPEELNLLSTTKNFSSGSNDEEMPMKNSNKVRTRVLSSLQARTDQTEAKQDRNRSNRFLATLQFFVEKQGNGGNTRIDICCATSPGALISTVSALDVLGLEIEQCAVSCFGDFAMKASCSQVNISWD